MHILLIEPNTLLAQTYTEALTHIGYTVAHAAAAQSAVLAADAQQPDMVILELQLPAHSGVEFLHEFRSYPEWQHVPVVVHTVLPPQKLHAAAQALSQDLGVSAFLYKPRTTLEQLLHAVRTHMPAVHEASTDAA
jgi:DNA-binding response OmpR family regulator